MSNVGWIHEAIQHTGPFWKRWFFFDFPRRFLICFLHENLCFQLFSKKKTPWSRSSCVEIETFRQIGLQCMSINYPNICAGWQIKMLLLEGIGCSRKYNGFWHETKYVSQEKMFPRKALGKIFNAEQTIQ